VVVKFSEADAKLLKFAPVAATALTDANGVAVIDISALTTDSVGATTVAASVTVNTIAGSGARSFSISAGAVSVQPKAINFVAANPSGQSIVIKGAGGNGRSESATLTFKVVDGSGSPVSGTTVAFAANPSNLVTLSAGQAETNADGLVTVAVQSGTTATSVIVVATAGPVDAKVSAQSDTLIVSNGLPFQAGFEIVAEKYNLDGQLTGDSVQVTANVRDVNGNPVPDGLAISFVTDFGVIASSTLGGCLTQNGQCSVEFRVQDPRGTGIATIVGSARLDVGSSVSDSISINMAGATGGSYQAVPDSVTLSACSESIDFLLNDGNLHAPAKGSTIRVSASSPGISASVFSGSPVLDQRQINFPPAPFSLQFDLGAPDPKTGVCPGLASGASGQVVLTVTTPSNSQFQQRITVVKR
jgi:hypothetical protein